MTLRSITARLIVPLTIFLLLGIAWFISGPLTAPLATTSDQHTIISGAIVIGLWLAGAWLFYRIVNIVLWDGIIGKALGKRPPRLIVQIGGMVLFLVALSGILRTVFDEPITGLWATSGVVGVVIGFALRNLILDTFSGLAIQMEGSFKTGDWINCHTRFGEYIGRVEETNWRTTRLWTTDGNRVVIPNSFLTNTIVTNYSQPEEMSRFELYFTLSFDVEPERAVRVMLGGARDAIGPGGLLEEPAPRVRVTELDEDGYVYRLQYHLLPSKTSPAAGRHAVISNIASHLRAAGLSLAHRQHEVQHSALPPKQADWRTEEGRKQLLQRLSLFIDLDPDDIDFLAKRAEVKDHKAGEILVRQGEDGSSMFIIAEGLLQVTVNGGDGKDLEVAELGPGNYIGEISLLTGEVRSATVRTETDAVVCELTKQDLAELFGEHPEVSRLLSLAVAARSLQNETAIATSPDEAQEQLENETNRFLGRLRAFFGLANQRT